MYRTYDDRWWYGGLYRKDLVSQHCEHGNKQEKKGCGKTKKNRVYLSDVVRLEDKIIIAKPVDIVYTKKDDSKKSKETSDVRTIYNYTYFKDYVEFYHYIKLTKPKQRIFHEVTPEHSCQKARFDVDIEREKYEAFITASTASTTTNFAKGSVTSFAKFGDYVKDLVIRNVVEVLKDYNLPLDLEKDVCIFTSHRSSKRSYHIIINRYFHYGSVQAQEFYRLCKEKCASLIDVKLFKTFIDAGIYDRNHPLRTWYSVKKENGVCYEKKFTEEFTFEGNKYTHQLQDEAFSEEEDEEMSDKIKKLHILHRSLITYTNESVALPSFPITTIERETVISMSGDTYKECCELITAWDKKNIFTIEGEEDGQIHLLRDAPSLCEICRPIREGTGETPVHDNMNAFCYIHRGHLYWHCFRAKGYSGICLGKLKSYRNQADIIMDDYLKDIMQEDGVPCMILEEDGTEYCLPEDESSYEDEVIAIKVDSKLLRVSGDASESSSSESSGESFSDDSLDEKSEDISFTKVAVIASNKSRLKVPAKEESVKTVMVDGTDNFLAKISRVVIGKKVKNVEVSSSPVVKEALKVPSNVEFKVNIPIVEVEKETVSITSKEKISITSSTTKGKDKESMLDVVAEDGKHTFNFAQNLRQQSKCKVKYTSKNSTTTKSAAKLSVETTSSKKSNNIPKSNVVRNSGNIKKTLGGSISSLNKSQDLAKSRDSISVNFPSNKSKITLNSLKHINY